MLCKFLVSAGCFPLIMIFMQRSGEVGRRSVTWINKAWLLSIISCVSLAQVVKVKPAAFVTIKRDVIKLSKDKPDTWASGTPLPGLQTGYRAGLGPRSGAPVPGALDPASVIVKRGHQHLVEGKDYVFDHKWGTFGIGPHSRVALGDDVTVTYRYSTLRLDSLVRTASGRIVLKEGKADISTPHPPELAPGEARILNLFVPYFSDGNNADSFPISESAREAMTATSVGRVPKTLTKLRSGQAVNIVCWGDSITDGGDASAPDRRYPHLFEEALRKKFPAANVSVTVVAAGGSSSPQWLYPEKFPYTFSSRKLGWDQVIATKPDLVTIEFINDGFVDAQTISTTYKDVLTRLQAIGAEVILITPSFANLDYMGFKTLRDTDSRPYVAFLRNLSQKNQLAIADVAARWQHLYKEGIPYITLLNNGTNHPDDRGHQMFVDELMKSIEP